MTNDEMQKLLRKIIMQLDRYTQNQTRRSVSEIVQLDRCRATALQGLKRLESEKGQAQQT